LQDERDFNISRCDDEEKVKKNFPVLNLLPRKGFHSEKSPDYPSIVHILVESYLYQTMQRGEATSDCGLVNICLWFI
jgi:hypothetical protein